tara:strand:+ start:602 stop:865 length:264 start_codon:yes stop_codon:yes gene_type:complete
MKNRYTLYTEGTDGTLTKYRRVNSNLPWEDNAFVIVDTRDNNRIVARFDEGTAFPNNPLTQAWNELDRLNYDNVKVFADKVRKEYEK